jgi:peptidoglycan/LPS O-acetylase OafA/YrhL
VIVFFVLSGFVIAYITDRASYVAPQFAADRIARIASVAVPAVVLTLVLDTLGQAARPDLYATVLDRANGLPAQVGAAFLFVNESWFGSIGVGSNTPYWSLPYEVWYYVAPPDAATAGCAASPNGAPALPSKAESANRSLRT